MTKEAGLAINLQLSFAMRPTKQVTEVTHNSVHTGSLVLLWG